MGAFIMAMIRVHPDDARPVRLAGLVWQGHGSDAVHPSTASVDNLVDNIAEIRARSGGSADACPMHKIYAWVFIIMKRAFIIFNYRD